MVIKLMPLKKRRPLNITVQFFTITLIIISSTMIITFFVSYEVAKRQVLDVGGEMFTNTLKDAVGFMDAMNQRVEDGDMKLEDAQDIVRTYLLGPKDHNGLRDISKSKMSTNDYMYIWAIQPNGTMAMHPFNFEGRNMWDLKVDGKYTIRESWTNLKKTGRIFREVWQNPGEPVYTFISYQEYYAPWDWVVGAGGREEMIYTRRLETMKYTFLKVTALIFCVAYILIFLFTRRVIFKVNKISNALNEVGRGNIKQNIHFKVNDEFGVLADNFNNMSKNLQKFLGKKVAVCSINDESEQYLRMLSESESRLRNMMNLNMIRAQEEERKRLARELHDRIGQSLYSVVVAMNLLNREKHLNESTQRYLDDVEAEISRAMSELKSIINGLRPASIEKSGLTPAMTAYIKTYELKWGIQVDFRNHTTNRRYPQEIELAVYRVFQEALLNARKYSKSDKITIDIFDNNDQLDLVIQDFGVGFKVSDKRPGKDGFGLNGMKERILLLEGSFDIESDLGMGTQVSISIPLPAE
ncbi:cache domain-containing protein [Paenibacillus sp. FSL F4-0125]|uniref:cache domain-containing protein n=1 Tax=Paenibacillus sp. FSL F4-0125 TaxID=2954730 RepID=UPI0030F946C5